MRIVPVPTLNDIIADIDAAPDASLTRDIVRALIDELISIESSIIESTDD